MKPQFCCDPIDVTGDLHGVDPVDQLEEGERLADFIRLHMADEVPAQATGQRGDLHKGLLHPTFPEEFLTRLHGFDNLLHGVCLGDGDQLHLPGIASGPARGVINPGSDGFKIFGDRWHRRIGGDFAACVISPWGFTGNQVRLCPMHIEGFKVFCDLCDTGNFSRAAEASGITQSAVSQQIRAVEKRFGVPLIDRSNNHFTLTPEGRIYLEVCRDILTRYDSLDSRFRVARGKLGGKLRVASVISIALHNLPPLLKQFRKDHPGVEVTVDYRKAEEIYTAVEDGRADLGLVAYPKARPGLRAITCWQERLVLVMPHGHKLAGKRPVLLNQLEGERFVGLTPDIPTRQHLDKVLRQGGVKVSLVAELENIETVKGAVEAEQAISIIPETSVRQEIKLGTLISRPIEADRMWRPMGAVTRRPMPEKPSLLEFLSLLSPRAKALIPQV